MILCSYAQHSCSCILQVAAEEAKCIDVTYEDPAEDLQAVRERLDLERTAPVATIWSAARTCARTAAAAAAAAVANAAAAGSSGAAGSNGSVEFASTKEVVAKAGAAAVIAAMEPPPAAVEAIVGLKISRHQVRVQLMAVSLQSSKPSSQHSACAHCCSFCASACRTCTACIPRKFLQVPALWDVLLWAAALRGEDMSQDTAAELLEARVLHRELKADAEQESNDDGVPANKVCFVSFLMFAFCFVFFVLRACNCCSCLRSTLFFGHNGR